ncbi:PREDICTED: uncharacterized protein LOC106809558 [Priapulus caudatus]|uniref:Uncharacterized protein LOC106809558 n=1 Tax=Priapulus caudatus TaxID=37621 RepID=A0ABM1E7J5_PRICU|nr:PREDICTED: uncharacterized protein LOC106809558 [Priapulus caudatus]
MLTGSPHTVSSRGDILIQEDPVSDVRREELAAVMDDLPPLDHEALERLSHAESELKMTDALLFHDDVSSALNERVEEDAGTRQPTTDPEQEDTVLEIDPKTGDLINSLIETPIVPSAVEPRHLPVQRRSRSDTKSPRSQRKRGRPERFDSLEIDSLDLADVPQKRRAARRLRFVDGSTQLSREQLRRNMNNTSDTMRPLDTIYPSRQESAADLFSKPGLRGLQREPHLSLWRRNAFTEQMSERDESDSENDKNIPYTIRDMLRQLQQNDESSSVVEERREDSTLESTSAQDQPLTSTAIKASSGKRKRSIDSDDPEQQRDRSNTNESSSNLPVTSFQHLSGIQSMHEDSRISDRQTSAASRNIESITESLNRRADVAILEEPELEQQLQPEHMENPPIYVEEPREVPAEMEIPAQARITPAHVYRKLEELLQGDASLEIPFRILVPVDMPKWVAAKYFYCCLVLLKQRKISCQQERPYDDIFIWLRRRIQ